jgi:hypothetical protein
MTDTDRRALALLCSCASLVGPQQFGELLWPEGRYRGSACSAPYARPAGRVLNRLRDQGLAEWVSERENWGWRATASGRKAI